MLLEGQQCSHYRLIKLLKRGGMGEVYLGEDTLLNRPVAIKVIYTDSASPFDPKAAQEAVNLFFREARVIAQFDHTHILPLYDSGEDSINDTKVMYMVMPLRQEGSFADWWYEHARRGPLPLPAVERVVRQAAEALQHAHDRRVVHKDVKPSNFLVRGHAEHPSQLDLQLADFGIAKIALLTSESQSIRGTPSYMAPEQWEGRPVPATDQYALAIMAYELLTGRTPFEGKEYQQLWHQHNYMRPERPSSVHPGIPREIDEVLLRALEKDPKQRFASISAFAHAFQRAVIDSGNIQHTVKVSPFEARVGTVRLLKLDDGREVTVPVPAGACQGQIIRLENNGRPTTYDGSRGALIVTIAIDDAFTPLPANHAGYMEPTVPVFLPGMEEISVPPLPVPRVPVRQRRAPASKGPMVGLVTLCLFLLSGSLCYLTNKQYNANAINTAQQVAAVTASARASTRATTVADAGTAAASTATARSQATAAVMQANPLPGYFSDTGTLAFDDSLADSSSNLWVPSSTSTPQNGNCMSLHQRLDASVGVVKDNSGVTTANGITSVGSDITFHPCIKEDMTQVANYVYRNFAYEVNMTINEGDCGGVAFRAASQSMYYFVICENGAYRLVRYKSDSGGSVTLIPDPTSSDPISSAIHTGITVNNTIAVEASGAHIDLFVNQTKIDSIDDPSYSSGYVGVLAKSLQPAASDPTDVVFTNSRVWTIS